MISLVEEEPSINVLTLNVWGLPDTITGSRQVRRRARIQAIADRFAKANYDVIAIQEAFIEEDRDRLIQGAIRGGLEHSWYFQSGWVGSGCLILSRFPFTGERPSFQRFTLNGKPQRIQHGDWYAGKGIGRCTVLVRDNLALGVFTLHTHANYFREGERDEYFVHRLWQMHEARTAVEQWCRRTACPALLLGDFNCTPNRPEFSLFTEDPAWQNLWDIAAEAKQTSGPCTSHGDTGMIDHILGYTTTSAWSLFVERCATTFTASNDTGEWPPYFSDHNGVEATVVFIEEEPPPSSSDEDMVEVDIVGDGGWREISWDEILPRLRWHHWMMGKRICIHYIRAAMFVLFGGAFALLSILWIPVLFMALAWTCFVIATPFLLYAVLWKRWERTLTEKLIRFAERSEQLRWDREEAFIFVVSEETD